MISETETDYTERPSTQSTQSKSQLTSRIMNGSQYQRKVVHQMTLGDSQSEVFCAKFDPEDKYIACGYGDGVARIYNLQTGKLSFQLSGSLQLAGSIDDMPITALKWRPQSAQLKTMNVLVTAQADGSLKHWHSTSGKCLHSRLDNPDNHLYCLDFNPEGTLLAAAGRDCHVRIYDETTKSLAVTMKERGDLPGHSNRVFCVKFNPIQRDMVVSGGWDNTLQIYDIRQKGPVESIYGPHICGDSLDFRNDGYTLLAGSYRQDDAIQLFDLRKFKCVRTYEWDGPDGMGIAQREPEESVRMQQFRPKTAPLLYATMFNKTQDLILAGGAGKNQVRIFDYESGNIISIISDMERSILCMDVNKTKNGFAFGSADSCLYNFNLSLMETIQELAVNRIHKESKMNVYGSSFNNENDVSGQGINNITKRSKNDIKDIKSYRMLDRVQLDLESPRSKEEFYLKGVEQDLIDLRFKHFQSRLIDTLNRVLQEQIKQMQKEILDQKMIAKSASLGQLQIQPQNQGPNKSFNQPIVNQSHFLATTSTAAGLSTSIFPTEVIMLGGETKKALSGFKENMAKSQSVLTHRAISTTQSAQSPHNLKFLLTKTAFKDIQSSSVISGNYSSRYIENNIMSKTMGTTFNDNLRNSKTYRAHPIVEQKIQMELAKIERDKSQKIFKIQKELEDQKKKKQKLDEYEERLKKAEDKVNAKIRHISVDKRLKNEKRIFEAQHRAMNISKEQEYSILREYEKQNASISGSQLKQIQDQEKRLQVMKREQEFQERLRLIQEMKQEQEYQEMQSLEYRLESIDQRLNRSQMIHNNNIKRVQSEARAKNEIVRNKLIQYKNQQEELEKKEKQDYQDYENRVKKRLQNAHKEMSNLYDNMKSQKAAKVTLNQKNRKEEFMEQKMKMSQIQQRQREAEELQEEFKREQEHEFMLRNELRRLREEDIKKLRDRQRRLQDQKKLQILNKERENDEFMKHIKESESVIQKRKLEAYVLKIKETDEVKKTLVDIAVKGKIMTPRSKKRLEQEGIMMASNLTKRKMSLKNFNENY